MRPWIVLFPFWICWAFVMLVTHGQHLGHLLGLVGTAVQLVIGSPACVAEAMHAANQ